MRKFNLRHATILMWLVLVLVLIYGFSTAPAATAIGLGGGVLGVYCAIKKAQYA